MFRSIIVAAIAACALATSAFAVTLPKAAVTAGYDDLAPFSIRLDLVCSAQHCDGSFPVPAGQRLVIDYVSANMAIDVGSAAALGILTYLNGQEVEAHLPMQTQGVLLGRSVLAVSAPMKIFADPNSSVTVFTLTSSTAGGGIVGVYGHLVPVN
jgi:hypothetical protein